MDASGRGLSFTVGGDSEASYSNNSLLQKSIINEAWPLTKKAIWKVVSNASESKFSFADLGCSSGPNTLSVVANVVDNVEEACRKLAKATPEIQVFLNDLPGNDFNSLFCSLYSILEKNEDVRGTELQSGCFPAGVAGSFYGRLFPSRSIHLFHSSCSLQWLSKDPLKAQEERGVLLNKGHIYISQASPASMRNIYARQFEGDFAKFLRSRSTEITVGGRMVLNLLVREHEDPAKNSCHFIWNAISQELSNLVKEAFIKKEELDSFNLPIYFPLRTEIEFQIDREGSFLVEDQKLFEARLDLLDGTLKKSKGQIVANFAQAVVGPFLGRHFGYESIELLFQRLKKAFEEDTSIMEIKVSNLVISLTTK